ncbi:Aste57867_18468 [Aphanomyces stellatus]|uniref:Aste57867_18468 protein n=1 Tax=Aphanomyces stellatus TaxID=120398 RepID=A0A485LAI0_9STRA|nr:hypothetical protein As57867_018406 [Aphanomyces stellatus]VFT95204.1 Aste57867_18468 [Aphanomyces stellatus]
MRLHLSQGAHVFTRAARLRIPHLISHHFLHFANSIQNARSFGSSIFEATFEETDGGDHLRKESVAENTMISLAHVKSSQQAADAPSNPRRIAWPGGKLVSNKEEALRKFMERKQGRGGSDDDDTRRKSTTHASAPPKHHGRGHAQTAKKSHDQKKGLFKKHHAVHKQPRTIVKKSSAVPKRSIGGKKAETKPLPTTKKLSMSLDDIVKKKK